VQRRSDSERSDGGQIARRWGEWLPKARCSHFSLCCHEAGHAVAAHVLGASLKRAIVQRGPGAELLGYCEFGSGLEPIALAAVGLVGALAAEALAGTPLVGATAAGGRDFLDSRVSLLRLPAEERESGLETALALAERIVREHRASILRLARWIETFGQVGPGIGGFLIETAGCAPAERATQ
jgi:hypothetical protein